MTKQHQNELTLVAQRIYEIVYPAVGSDHSGVRLTIPELEKCSGYKDWVDVCKEQ